MDQEPKKEKEGPDGTQPPRRKRKRRAKPPYIAKDFPEWHPGVSYTQESKTRRVLEVYKNNHCATIAPHPDGAILAFYTGPEGRKEQQVVVVLWDRHFDTYYLLFRLSEGTGNPVLWAERFGNSQEGGLVRNVLLFSRFEWGRSFPWEDCSLWLLPIHGMEAGEIEKFPARNGLLGRCPPVYDAKEPGNLLLPLYHERPAYGVIYRRPAFGSHWSRLGAIGKESGGLMQPSMWWDTKQKRFHAICRNSEAPRAGSGKALFSFSKTGRRWSEPQPLESYNNYSNSVVVIPDKNGRSNWIVWNDDAKGRRSLSIAPLLKPAKKVRLNRAPHASYPNWCWIGDDLHLVWTEGVIRRSIVHKVLKDFQKQ